MQNPVEWLFDQEHPRVVGVPIRAWALLSLLLTFGGVAAWSAPMLALGLTMLCFPVALGAPAMLADRWR
jgi:hypothetical protein